MVGKASAHFHLKILASNSPMSRIASATDPPIVKINKFSIIFFSLSFVFQYVNHYTGIPKKGKHYFKKDAINFAMRYCQKSFIPGQTLVLVTFLLGHFLKDFEFFGGGNFSRRFSDSWNFFGGGITFWYFVYYH